MLRSCAATNARGAWASQPVSVLRWLSKVDRGQVTVTMAPWSGRGRFSKVTVAPDRSKQGLGNEKAKAESGGFTIFDLPGAARSTRGDVGLSQGIEHIEGNARTVVG